MKPNAIEPRDLLARLDAIGQSLASHPDALALIGLGSVGLELDRLDRFSDLDFFAIVEAGSKQQYLESLSWLGDVAPIAYAFQNTRDGHKVLYADGIFCEFAVFEPAELDTATFTAGRVVWKRADISEAIATCKSPLPKRNESSVEFMLGEALTCLLIGLKRYQRGEKLTALRFVQQYALDHVLNLAATLEPEQSGHRDPFSPERRLEQRYPVLASLVPSFMQGYDRTPESTLAILSFLEANFAPDAAIVDAIRNQMNETA